MKAALIGLVLLAAACATTGEIDGHRIRGTAAPIEQQTVANDLHQNAPQWFKDWWARYLEVTQGHYGIFAVDRQAKGSSILFCGGGTSCNNTYSIRLTNERRALDLCRRNVRENHPAMKPDCAIYAIKDKIVWQGKMPWK